MLICTLHRRMRGINIGGGATKSRAFKHFGEELIIICQQEPGLHKNIGGPPAPPAPPPPSYTYALNMTTASHFVLRRCSTDNW